MESSKMINDVLTWVLVTHSDPISVQMEMSQDVSGVQMSRILLARLHHTLSSVPVSQCQHSSHPHYNIQSSQLSVLILSNSNSSDSIMSGPGPSFRPPGMLLSSSEILCFQTPDIILHKSLMLHIVSIFVTQLDPGADQYPSHF